MTVKLVQLRDVIGIFNCRSSVIPHHECNLTQIFVSMFEVLLYCWHYFESAFIFLLTLEYILIILQCQGDIEPKPGPRKLKTNSFLLCHWNLNSLPAHNLFEAYTANSIYSYDFICLSETYMSTSIPDNLIDIEGYKLTVQIIRIISKELDFAFTIKSGSLFEL